MYGVFFTYMKISLSIWVHEDASPFSPAFFLTISVSLCFCSKNLASVLGKAQCRKSPVVKSGFRWYTKRGTITLIFAYLDLFVWCLEKEKLNMSGVEFTLLRADLSSASRAIFQLWMIHLLYGGFYEHNLKQRHSISEIYNHSWWLQPIPKNICLSNWIMNPQGPGWNCKQLSNFTT